MQVVPRLRLCTSISGQTDRQTWRWYLVYGSVPVSQDRQTDRHEGGTSSTAPCQYLGAQFARYVSQAQSSISLACCSDSLLYVQRLHLLHSTLFIIQWQQKDRTKQQTNKQLYKYTNIQIYKYGELKSFSSRLTNAETALHIVIIGGSPQRGPGAEPLVRG